MTSITAALPTEELELVLALSAGDEDAFTKLVNRYQSAMLQVALTYVGSRAIAEEVVQEAWLGVLNGIGRFEGRSQLKTWIMRIVINRAKRRGSEEAAPLRFQGCSLRATTPVRRWTQIGFAALPFLGPVTGGPRPRTGPRCRKPDFSQGRCSTRCAAPWPSCLKGSAR